MNLLRIALAARQREYLLADKLDDRRGFMAVATTTWPTRGPISECVLGNRQPHWLNIVPTIIPGNSPSPGANACIRDESAWDRPI
jgi:hypothetical protein